MLSMKEKKIANLLLDKGQTEQTVVSVLHATETEKQQDRMIHFLQTAEEITKDMVMAEVKGLFKVK